MDNTVYSDELQHWGIRGMKWGVRRYQNKDGTLTAAGQKRYNKEMETLKKETAKVKEQERIAANRKKTQAKIDKLDAKKQELEARKQALKDEKSGKKPVESDKPEETIEEKRARLLNSNNPKELYENRNLLTTNELNERINRIDTEARLQSKIVEEHTKTGMEYVDSARNKLDKATSLFRSVDNAYSTVMNSAIGKSVAKMLGIEAPKKVFDLEKALKDPSSISAQEAMDENRKMNALNSLRKTRNELNAAAEEKKAKETADKKAQEDAKAADKKAQEDAKAADKKAKEAQKQVDDYNEKWKKGESDDKVTNPDTTYGKSGDDIVDKKVATGKAGTTERIGIEMKPEKAPTDSKVYGEGTSRYQEKESKVVDAEFGKDFRYADFNYPAVNNQPISNLPSTEVYSLGSNYMSDYWNK